MATFLSTVSVFHRKQVALVIIRRVLYWKYLPISVHKCLNLSFLVGPGLFCVPVK